MTPLILKTCGGFVHEGFEVELWVPRRRNAVSGDPFALHGVEPSFAVRYLPVLDLMHVLGKPGFWLMVASFNLAVWWQLAGERKAVLYGHDLRDFILPGLRGLSLFVEIHDFYESSLEWLNRLVLKRATGLVVTNRIKMRRLHEHYGFAEARMIWQPNAVNVAQFARSESVEEARAELGLPAGRTIALYTGHLFGWKGVHTLAEAAARLPESVYVYFVGGTAEDRAALQGFVGEHRLPRIEFVEHQPHERMPLFMRAADVLVLPNTAKEEASRLETSPVKLFEYLASGRPIVASDLPSLREVVSEKEVAFFNPDDAQDLAKVIGETLNNKSETEKRVVAASELAKKHSWEARAKAITTFIKAL